jgi:hypothetical protein
MIASTQVADNRIEQYLSRLEFALGGVDPGQREDILREIRAHMIDSTAGSTDRDAAVDQVVHRLGTPEELAERYSTECLLQRAGRSVSPWLLLRTCWRWAMLGTKGMLAFFLALVGYTTALTLTISIFLKPFVPAVGLWLGAGKCCTLQIGTPDHPERMHELLGQWFVPVIAVVAFGAAIGTTRALRWMIRSRSSSLTDQVMQSRQRVSAA